MFALISLDAGNGHLRADLANVVNEAALRAAARAASQVEMRDFEEAIDRVLLGFQKRASVMSAQEKQRVAWHESGHALVALRRRASGFHHSTQRRRAPNTGQVPDD